MSASQEQGADLVAVACVAESSLLLASEWSRILFEYVYPLLKRLHELYPSHQFRLAFVTYATSDTRPRPLLSKRYFAPLSQITKELREEPSKLGIGQTNYGNGKGLAALEGLVAAIELFDILMASANFNSGHAQTQSPQKDNRSLISHLLHIAASPPDATQRPNYNTLQHLDSVNWDSIPVELRKRKINFSLISLRKLPQFQDLQSSVAGPGVQSPWFNVHTPHVLSLAGFPTPQKTSTKRPTDAQPTDQSPDMKRQKVVGDPISKTPSASSPALSSARIQQTQRPQQPVSSQLTPSTTVPGQNSSPAQSVPATTSMSASTPATVSPVPPSLSAPPLASLTSDILEQVVAPTNLKFREIMENLKVLEKDIHSLEAKIQEAQNNGQTAADLQKQRAPKAQLRDQIKILLKGHYHKVLFAKDSQSMHAAAAGPAPPNPSAKATPSTQPHLPNVPNASSDRSTGSTAEETKPVVSDPQPLAQIRQPRVNMIPTSDSNNTQAGPSQAQSLPAMTPEAAAQTQKLIEKRGIRPQNVGPSPQTTGTTSQETALHPNTTNNQLHKATTWSGTFSWTYPKHSNQITSEVQIHVAGVFSTPMPTEVRNEIRTDLWPRHLTLVPCKEPVKDVAELSTWIRRHQPRTRVMQFLSNPRAPDAPANDQKFQALFNFMNEHRIFAYTGWRLPSGQFSHYIFIFPMSKCFAGAMFPDGLPDLPGSGNSLDAQPPVPVPVPVAEAKPQVNGVPIPPALLARIQGLDPAKQRQFISQFIRAQQENLRRQQQLQQTQQVPPTSVQASGSLAMSIPPNPYSAVTSIPAGLHANVNPPTNTPAYNATGGTVNYEMLQSFMQRNAEGSTSQGTNLG